MYLLCSFHGNPVSYPVTLGTRLIGARLFSLRGQTWMQSYRFYNKHSYLVIPSSLSVILIWCSYWVTTRFWWCDVYYSRWQFGSYEIPRSKHTLLVNTALRTVPCTITRTTLAKALHVYVNDSHHSSMRFWEPKSPNMDMWSSIWLINSIVRR